jgi:hypothetical protein
MVARKEKIVKLNDRAWARLRDLVKARNEALVKYQDTEREMGLWLEFRAEQHDVPERYTGFEIDNDKQSVKFFEREEPKGPQPVE